MLDIFRISQYETSSSIKVYIKGKALYFTKINHDDEKFFRSSTIQWKIAIKLKDKKIDKMTRAIFYRDDKVCGGIASNQCISGKFLVLGGINFTSKTYAQKFNLLGTKPFQLGVTNNNDRSKPFYIYSKNVRYLAPRLLDKKRRKIVIKPNPILFPDPAFLVENLSESCDPVVFESPKEDTETENLLKDINSKVDILNKRFEASYKSLQYSVVNSFQRILCGMKSLKHFVVESRKRLKVIEDNRNFSEEEFMKFIDGLFPEEDNDTLSDRVQQIPSS